MKSSDWVALGGVIISILAFGVAYLAYRLQARSATSDSQKELADQIDAIHARMAELERTPPPGGSIAAITQNANVNAALQALVLRADALITFAQLSPDWYQNLVLASAALQIGDVLMAAPYAEQGVILAGRPQASGWDTGAGAAARVISLRTRAWLCFLRGRPEDLESARADYDHARQIVQGIRDQQGPNLTSVQLIELYVRQADFELDVGDSGRAVTLMGQACELWLGLGATGARREAGGLISALAQQRGNVPRLLTDDFVREWNAFLQGQGGGGPAAGLVVIPGPPGHSAVLPGLSGLRPINVGASIARADGPAAGLATPADPDR